MHASTSNRPAHRTPLSIAIAAVLAFAAVPAFAQEAAADSASNADADAKKTTELQSVVVTANKRPEDVLNVASSISVVGEEQMQSLGAAQLTDYAAYVPGLQVASDGTPGQTRVSLRGIAPLSSGATVGTYIDDSPVGSNGIYQAATIFMLDLLPYDIERVEILRGPQGTLYGAGSMGGLIKYVTKAPDLVESEFRIGGGVSSVADGGTGNNLRFGANVPLLADRLGMRVSYSRNNQPGYVDNSITGEDDINEVSQTSARLALLWQGDAFNLKLTAMRQGIDSDNNGTVSLDPADYSPLDGESDHLVYVDAPFQKDVDYYAATLSWDLGWGDFTSATGYSKIDTRVRQDVTVDYGRFTDLGLGLPFPGASYFDTRLDFTQLTQEFRLASKAGQRFDWLVGAFYSKESGDNRQHIQLTQLDGSALPDPFEAIAGDLATLNLPTRYKELSFFANASYQFSERFKLGGGVRYAKNDQTFSQDVTSGLLLPIGSSPNGSKENVFTWSLAPQFQLSKDTLLYARVATGYQPGGPNVKLPGVPDQVDSSTLANYELGLKSLFADNRVQVELAVFRIDWEDIQVISTFDGASGLVNGGTATSQGIEFSSLFQPTANLRLGFNAAWTDAELTEDFPTLVVPSDPYIVNLLSGLGGDRMPYTPKLSFSATADYFIPLGGNGWEAHIGGGYRWVGDRVNGTTEREVILDGATMTPVQTTVTAPLKLDSYGAFDLYAGVSNDHWSIRAFLKNAGDRRAYSTVAAHENQLTGVTEELVAAPIQPRTFGIEVDYRF
ncbi:TonB-dependent receptor [Thermomonas carbonis]|uniref:TonB-dependent receptor n=1 Tax=Thermomonas carbonis TaxID=1463158 RepID=A0A7G9SLR9_9GAMM|nr:TonB-dependent receptor [Thermomonas carbonis]QNN68794.1 TonB-dependent receptor [Thermomonas carbonis]GHC08719.1 TonB-dependent receptor [Thermomonas carbonis]